MKREKTMIVLLACLLLVGLAVAQIHEDWVTSYNGPANWGRNEAVGVCVDEYGNVYIAGTSAGILGGYYDYLVIKCNPDGETLWTTRYSSASWKVVDKVYAMALDADNNVYVTGSFNAGGYGDFGTIKLDTDGNVLWVATYTRTSTSHEWAQAIAVDPDGNVYVTGPSQSDLNYDFVTVKYNSSGVQQWAATYKGPGDGASEQPYSIVLDRSGNVIVTGWTGSSDNNGISLDWATVKYSPDGVELWAKCYDGLGHGRDQAYAVAVDGSDNVCVTGYSTGSTANGHDITTIKYSPDGDTLWTQRRRGSANTYNYGYGVATDDDGNVYVTGECDNGVTFGDIATIKYNPSGAEQWFRTHHARDIYGSDVAREIAVDGDGNVYVAGTVSITRSGDMDYATLKYDSDGTQLWVATYGIDGPYQLNEGLNDLAVDASGSVYVTGYSPGTLYDAMDYATVKYNANGVEQWVSRYEGRLSLDVVKAVVADASGNVYAVGYCTGVVGGISTYDYLTIKYSPSGEILWTARYDEPTTQYDCGGAIAVDADGNVYVTGYTGTDFTDDYATVKYNSSGVQQWVALYDGPIHDLDVAYGITVDGDGNVYVTGYSVAERISGPPYDRLDFELVTVKYNSAGVQQWDRGLEGPKDYVQYPNAIALDAGGNIYVTGYCGDQSLTDYVTAKYSSDGSLLWTAKYNGPSNREDVSRAIALDALSNVYVTGISTESGTSRDYATVKYDADGDQLWVARYDGAGPSANGIDRACAIAVDNAGGVYVTGYSQSPPGDPRGYDYATVKYDADGNQLWVARYDGPGNTDDAANGLVLDAAGDVWVTGYSTGIGSGAAYDYATIKYSPDGTELGVAPYDGPDHLEDVSVSICADALGGVCVTGYSRIVGEDYNVVTIKYSSVVPNPNPWGGTMLSQGYWKTHLYYDPQHPDAPYIEKYLPVTMAGVIVSTVPEALGILDPPRPLTAWKMFLTQFLAARLNAGWQTDPSLLAAWYDLPGGDYPFDNQRVAAIFEVADGYRSTTDRATLDEMKTVLWNMNRYIEEDSRCLWDAQFPPGAGPQGAEVGSLASKLNLSVSPSVVKSGIVRIAYSLPRAGPAQLKVLDITGRTVMTQCLPTAVGDHVISLDASSWSAGVYFLKLASDACSLTRKVVIE